MAEDSDADDQVHADVVDHVCQLSQRWRKLHLGEPMPVGQQGDSGEWRDRYGQKQNLKQFLSAWPTRSRPAVLALPCLTFTGHFGTRMRTILLPSAQLSLEQEPWILTTELHPQSRSLSQLPYTAGLSSQRPLLCSLA